VPSDAGPAKVLLFHMRKIMNISLSEEMYSLILERANAGCHSTVSEYIRSLVRRDLFEHRGLRQRKTAPPRRANDYFEQAAAVSAEARTK
jgi:Arc/MetJ-type ribon-helix-helix transcriptional regulator